jgi:hypothetical protein
VTSSLLAMCQRAVWRRQAENNRDAGQATS